jgi:type IV pilus assembly protein PilF|tara:strand:+ start:731 stop:1546 length:816 start_codon:yes stop_codon:yes gene_type:complete
MVNNQALKAKLAYLKVACFTLLTSLMLTGCVTTTSGGFTSTASDERAVEDYVNLAVGYYDVNDMAGARRNISNALKVDDRNSTIYNVLALILQREGDIRLAQETFERAISLDGDNARARNNYAALLFSIQDFQEAYDQLEQVVSDSMYEGRAIAFENLGRSALMIGKIDEAKNAFQRALQLNSNLYLSALELSIIQLNRNDLPGARSAFTQYLTIVGFYKITHPPKALLAGIKIESSFNNQKLVDEFSMLLMTLYQDTPEYKTYLELTNAN